MQCRLPLVIPFYHSGMGRLLPKGSVVPRIGNKIHVEVGEAVYLADLLQQCKCKEGQELQKVSVIDTLKSPMGTRWIFKCL